LHIPDGFIPIGQAAVYWIIALVFIARSVKWARKDMNENMIPLFGVLAAGMFVLQTINIAANLLIPLPMMTGVSWHVVGAALTAIIFASPWAAVLLLTLVLGVQSLFGDGGITAMGANILNMGIIGGFIGYYAYAGFGKLSIKRPVALFAAAWLSMIIPAIALAFELWFAGTFPLKQGVLLMGIFQGAAGIGEGLITVIVFGAILKARPDIVAEEGYKNVSKRSVAMVAVIALLGLALASPFLTSSNPDGLQQTANLVINKELNNVITPFSPLFPNYSIPGLGESGKIAAILIGFGAIITLWLGASKILKRV